MEQKKDPSKGGGGGKAAPLIDPQLQGQGGGKGLISEKDWLSTLPHRPIPTVRGGICPSCQAEQRPETPPLFGLAGRGFPPLSLQQPLLAAASQGSIKGGGGGTTSPPSRNPPPPLSKPGRGGGVYRKMPPLLSPLAEKFVKLLMVDGKKSKGLTLLSKALLSFKKGVKGGSEKRADRTSRPATPAPTPPLQGVTLGGDLDPSRPPTGPIKGRRGGVAVGERGGWEGGLGGLPLTKRSGVGSTLRSLREAVENVKPSLQLRQKRVAGISRQIPFVLSEKKRETIAIRWIIESARKKRRGSNKDFSCCLGEELIESFQKKGQARQKRDALHKLAESNRGFLRYRWW